jgi:hypothetical protein
MSDRDLPKIDREFRNLLPKHSGDEILQLEANLLADGEAICPIVVWQEANIVIDGVQRYLICAKYSLPYQIKYKSFASRGAAISWAMMQQLGRRNLTPQELGYLESSVGPRSAGIYKPS